MNMNMIFLRNETSNFKFMASPLFVTGYNANDFLDFFNIIGYLYYAMLGI